MKKKNKINPCPFCGNKEITVGRASIFVWVFNCNYCGASVTFVGEKKEEAIKDWNGEVAKKVKADSDEVKQDTAFFSNEDRAQLSRLGKAWRKK